MPVSTLLLVTAFIWMWALVYINRAWPWWYSGLRPDLRDLLFYVASLVGWGMVAAGMLALVHGQQ